MLRTLSQRLGNRLLHVLDRGYAGLPTLERFLRFEQHFLIRWKANMNLIDEQGNTKLAHQHARSHKGQHARLVWDKERKQHRRVSITFLPVTHAELPDQQLFLIIARDKNNYTSPMYLLTNIVVDSIGIAWELFFSYMHRYTIEQTFRFCKSELAMESPRLWFFRNRLKLLAMVALVYDFLLSLWRDWKAWAHTFTNTWAPRTGKRHQNVLTPLYRFREAISSVLNFLFYQNSG